MYQSNSCIEQLLFSFHSYFFIYQLNFCVFQPVWDCLLLSILGPRLFRDFSFFILFRMLWMIITMSKAKFSLLKTLITFSKCLATGWAIYKIKCTSWKAFLTLTYFLVCLLASAIIIFSEAHGMSCFHTQNFKLVQVMMNMTGSQ